MNRRSQSHSRRRSHRGQIAVGLVGVGPMWERRYRAAVERLADRISIHVVYDAVLAKAQLAATELGAEAVSGLRQVFERGDIQAVLVLDAAWYDLYPAELACRFRKPTFLAGSLGTQQSALESLHQLAIERETLLMTEFSRRYTPATSRLRELIATRLGEARQISVEALIPRPEAPGTLPGQACERDYLAGLLDWCQYITGRVPTSVRTSSTALAASNAGEGAEPPWQIELGFRPDSKGEPATVARLTLSPTSSTSLETAPHQEDADWPFPLHQIVCEHGIAEIRSAAEIGWQNGSAAALGVERLSSERSDAEVILDQFARRVLGGLVPVASLQDVCRALTLVAAAEESRAGPGVLQLPR